MQDALVPPLVVIEGRDFMFYASVDALTADIEPWYPSSAEYRAFDSEGRRFELSAEPPVTQRRILGPIWTDNAHKSSLVVRVIDATPLHADELVTLLRESVAASGETEDALRALDLKGLLAAAIERHGMS